MYAKLEQQSLPSSLLLFFKAYDFAMLQLHCRLPSPIWLLIKYFLHVSYYFPKPSSISVAALQPFMSHATVSNFSKPSLNFIADVESLILQRCCISSFLLSLLLLFQTFLHICCYFPRPSSISVGACKALTCQVATFQSVTYSISWNCNWLLSSFTPICRNDLTLLWLSFA